MCNLYTYVKVKVGGFVPFNSRVHIGSGPQHCHLWKWNTNGGDSL